jgi:hypothetical protein
VHRFCTCIPSFCKYHIRPTSLFDIFKCCQASQLFAAGQLVHETSIKVTFKLKILTISFVLQLASNAGTPSCARPYVGGMSFIQLQIWVILSPWSRARTFHCANLLISVSFFSFHQLRGIRIGSVLLKVSIDSLH